MLVRFGYVAMSTVIPNASPSKTMTATSFAKISDRDAAIRKLERIAAENLHNTLRLLRHNRANDIHIYRFSSKLIPLFGHELLKGWDPFPVLADDFANIGSYVREHHMRTGFHPDHFTVLSTPRKEVLESSYEVLDYHVRMLEAMGLDERAKCNIHIGGAYNDKAKTMTRFLQQFAAMSERIRSRIVLENDDKTFNALETLTACELLNVPMVLDIHHHAVNNNGESYSELWPRILATWKTQNLPPKIHASSPKSEKDPRGHADYLNAPDLIHFLNEIVEITPELDVMIEAKMKDGALFRLMEDLHKEDNIHFIGQCSTNFSK